MSSLETPVLILIFNRPDKVRALITALEHVGPTHLYVSADGPREGVETDILKCKEARELFQNLPWECEVFENFSEKNLGCMNGPVAGIDWFFKNETEGIILEDDCVPSPSFFTYTSELLENYRENEKIMHINGTTFLSKETTILPEESYYFSKIPVVWGWASWRRAWQKLDMEMNELEQVLPKLIAKKDFSEAKHARFWQNLFKHVDGKPELGIWDAQWAYSILNADGLVITPTTNLVENIGFGADATHTTKTFKPALGAKNTSGDVIHPNTIKVNRELDRRTMDKAYYLSPWKKGLIFVKRITSKLVTDNK